jgi:hypothetical protein
MIVDIDDMIVSFNNAHRELRKSRWAFDNDNGWYRHYGIKVHWRGAMMDKFEFKSEKDYLIFLLRWG